MRYWKDFGDFFQLLSMERRIRLSLDSTPQVSLHQRLDTTASHDILDCYQHSSIVVGGRDCVDTRAGMVLAASQLPCEVNYSNVTRDLRVQRAPEENTLFLQAEIDKAPTNGARAQTAAGYGQLLRFMSLLTTVPLNQELRVPPVSALRNWIIGTDVNIDKDEGVICKLNTWKSFVEKGVPQHQIDLLRGRRPVFLNLESALPTVVRLIGSITAEEYYCVLATCFCPEGLHARDVVFVDVSNSTFPQAPDQAAFPFPDAAAQFDLQPFCVLMRHVVADSFILDDVLLAMLLFSPQWQYTSTGSVVNMHAFEVPNFYYNEADHLIQLFTARTSNTQSFANWGFPAPPGNGSIFACDKFTDGAYARCLESLVSTIRTLKTAVTQEACLGYGINPFLGCARNHAFYWHKVRHYFELVTFGGRFAIPHLGADGINDARSMKFPWVPYEFLYINGSTMSFDEVPSGKTASGATFFPLKFNRPRAVFRFTTTDPYVNEDDEEYTWTFQFIADTVLDVAGVALIFPVAVEVAGGLAALNAPKTTFVRNVDALTPVPGGRQPSFRPRN